MPTSIALLIMLSGPAVPPAPVAQPSEKTATAPSSASLSALPTAERDPQRAATVWAQGVEAYRRGDLAEAIAGFEQTFRFSGRPGPLFSLGQAHRRHYEQNGDARQRTLSILRYEQYIELAPDGARVLEAQRHIHMLRVSEEDELEGLDEEAPIFTRIAVDSSTEGAEASLGQLPPRPLPTSFDVMPGKHAVTVTAPLHAPQTRRVDVLEGSTVTVTAELSELPATLNVEGPRGSRLYVDGEPVAEFDGRQARSRVSVETPSGSHRVVLAQRGRTSFVRETSLPRGGTVDIDAELETSGLRKVSVALVAMGGTAMAAGLGLIVPAVVVDRRAARLEQQRVEQSILSTEESRKRRLIQHRQVFATGAIAVGAGGLAVLATGIVLVFVDQPAAERSRDRQIRPTAFAGSRGGGVGLRGRF